MSHASGGQEAFRPAAPTAAMDAHLEAVDNQLNLLLKELGQLAELTDAPLPVAEPDEREERWSRAMEGFRVKATTIRRVMERFHHSDLPTRKFLRQHLDEEFAELRTSYDSLRSQFTEKEEER